MLFSFILDAQQGFECGVKQLIARLFELEVIKRNKGKMPTVKSYDEATDKIPVDVMRQMVSQSHQLEFKENGKTLYDLKIIIPDGTKISMSSTEQTVVKYGEGQGHYVQAQALGFFELSTGTFEDFKLKHSRTAERSICLEHMENNSDATLYLSDAGYNGMGYIGIGKSLGHELMMQLKNCALAKEFRKSKKRSCLIQIKLTKNHLVTYPNHQNLIGTTITLRLLRTRGTSKLSSQVLITTLIDEKLYTWQELTKLYRQRYTVELAFRHLKAKIGIEKIRKRKLERIEQLMHAAIILYNLSASLRNRLKRPCLLPQKEGVKMICFTLCIDLVHYFCIGAIWWMHGRRKKMNRALQTINSCHFLYKPWRAEPRICNTPPSEFTVQKGADILKEIEKAEFLKTEYEILALKYGQKETKIS